MATAIVVISILSIIATGLFFVVISLDEHPLAGGVFIVSVILLLVGGIGLLIESEQAKIEDCKSLGGEYQYFDTTGSQCIKKLKTIKYY